MILKNLHIILLSCIVQSSVKLYTCIFFSKTYECDKNVSIFIQKVTYYFCTMFIPYFDIFWFITNSYIYIVQNWHKTRTFAQIICNPERETLVNVIEIHLFRKYLVLCFIILFMYLSPKSSYHNLIARIAKKNQKKKNQ